MSSHRIVRSTISGSALVDVTVADTSVLSSPAMPSTSIVVRDVAASVRFCATVVPSPFRYVICTGAWTLFGFAIRMSVSKNAPVAPSAIV